VTLVDNGDGTATLSGTPSAGTGGIYVVTVTANNGVSPNATQTFTLTVNEAPAITSVDHVTCQVGVSCTFTMTSTGYPTPPLAKTGGLPGGITFVNNGNGTATLSGTPAVGSGNSYALTLTANNGVTPNATQAFTLIVNERPSFTSTASAKCIVGTPSSFTVKTRVYPRPAITETGSLPNGVSLVDNGDGTATLSCAASAGTGGIYALIFGATNSLGSSSQNFTLTVNEAPAITSANGTTCKVLV